MNLDHSTTPRRWVMLADMLLFALAALSLAFALATAPGRGDDLFIFHRIGRMWLEGSAAQNPYGYPPFAAAAFAPLGLLPFELLRPLWLAVNLMAAGLCVLFAARLWGEDWTRRTVLRLAAVFVSLAAFRVSLRLGQLSLVITALLAGALLARARKREALAGALLGLSLCKYPLTFPFVLYFAWKREWKVVAGAGLAPLLLSLAHAIRFDVSPLAAALTYARGIGKASVSNRMEAANTVHVKPLLTAALGDSQAAFLAALALTLLALAAMALVFRRWPRPEGLHFAALAMFALWPVYHRMYDVVVCVIPLAVWLGPLRGREFARWRVAWLTGLGVLALNLPGLLTERLRLSAAELAAHPLGIASLHVDRLIVFAMFWSLLAAAWKAAPRMNEAQESGVCARAAEGAARSIRK